MRVAKAVLSISLLSLLASLTYSIYIIHSAEGFSPTFASILGSYVLVMITAWYAWNTNQLLKINREQKETAKVTFAPKLDCKSEVIDNYMAIGAENVGFGMANDIEIIVSMEIVDSGLTTGKKYTYKANVNSSVLPGHRLVNGKYDLLVIEPQFIVELSETTFQEYMKNHGPVHRGFLTQPGMMSEDSFNYLIKYLKEENSGRGKIPLEVGSAMDVLNEHEEKFSSDHYFILDIIMKHSDINSEETYEEKLIENVELREKSNTLEDAIFKTEWMPPRGGISFNIFRVVEGWYNQNRPREECSYPYEENIDARTTKS